jgi:putative membrane protein
MRLLAIACSLAFAAAGSVYAQMGNPAGAAAATPQREPGMPAPHQPNAQDRLFVQLAGAGGMAEVDAGKMADAKAQNPAVKAFGRQMAQDHAKANDELTRLAQQANVPMPRELDPDHKAMRDALDRASGAQFDSAYLQAQLVDHQKTVQILEWEMSAGQDPELQRYASATLPIVMHHLAQVQALLGQVTGAGPQGLAAADPSLAKR